MAKFFTSPKDLMRWVKEANSSFGEASEKIMMAVGSRKNEQDIVETTKRIFSNNNVDDASETLFGLLANYNITEQNVKEAENKMNILVASDALHKAKVITADEKQQMIKEAQIMRQPGQYPMPLRVCPKLPYSVGKGLISTYNCRHYCLDSLTFDDDPEGVYCAEALWRKHVADKFSRDWQDTKTGDLVGGYINNRFYVFPDAGTPENPDVPKDHGNRMNLTPGERTRQERKISWSIERRLQEQRNPNSTKSITLANVLTDSKNMIKISSSEIPSEKEIVANMFSDLVDLHNSKVSNEDAALKVSEKYASSIEKVVSIQEVAIRKMSSHQADVYKTAAYANPLPTVNTYLRAPEGTKAWVSPVDQRGTPSAVEKEETIDRYYLGSVPQKTEKGHAFYTMWDAPNGQQVGLAKIPTNVALEDAEKGAKEVGLFEDNKLSEGKNVPMETNLPGKTPAPASEGLIPTGQEEQ